jgi:hypothetical protein
LAIFALTGAFFFSCSFTSLVSFFEFSFLDIIFLGFSFFGSSILESFLESLSFSFSSFLDSLFAFLALAISFFFFSSFSCFLVFLAWPFFLDLGLALTTLLSYFLSTFLIDFDLLVIGRVCWVACDLVFWADLLELDFFFIFKSSLVSGWCSSWGWDWGWGWGDLG